MEVFMFKKNLKSQKGFTLVEVIVVAVIVAVLAAVAIPLYINYVNDSRINSANNAAGAVASFCGACVSATGANVPAAAVTGPGTITCAGNNTTVAVPPQITVTITNNGLNGTVRATHAGNAGGAYTTYSY
jgi:prepilin-type N-terminal cleavage/methylation domain-containing protein